MPTGISLDDFDFGDFGDFDEVYLVAVAVINARPPASGSATGVTPTAILVQALPANGVGFSHELRRKVSGAANSTAVSVGTIPPGELTFRNEALTPGTVYAFSLRAINPRLNKSGPWGAWFEATTLPLPSVPTSVAIGVVTSTTMPLTWTDTNTGLSPYLVEYSLDNVAFLTFETTVAGAESSTITGLAAATLYYVRVSAVWDGAQSATYGTDSDTTSAAGGVAPGAPTNPEATAATPTIVELGWTLADATETGVEIERRSPGGSGAYSNITTTAAAVSAYTDTGRTANTSYGYRYRAINGSGNSAYTAEVIVTTPADSGLTIPATGSRILLSNSTLRTRAQTWSETHTITPTSPNLLMEHALKYWLTGDAASLAYVTNYLFGEDAAGVGFLMKYAYQGDLAGVFTEVGSFAVEYHTSGSNQFRWAGDIARSIDLCWDGLTSLEKTKAIEGWTTTWPLAGAFFGQVVNAPGYPLLAWKILKKTENAGVQGKITDCESNYFWGSFRNEVGAYLIGYGRWTDTVKLQYLFDKTLGLTSSRRSNMAAFARMQEGIDWEGSQYGSYSRGYMAVELFALKNMGLDLYDELAYFSEGVYSLIYRMTGAPCVKGTVSGSDYYQWFPYNDDEESNGYPPVKDNNGFMVEYLAGYSLARPGTNEDGYCRRVRSLTSMTAPVWWQAIDTVGTARDWRDDALPLDRFDPDGSGFLVSKSNWSGSALTVLTQGKFPISDTHRHLDVGSIQVMRTRSGVTRWLCKEQTGYSMNFAADRFIGTVAASPTPTATSFAATNIGTSSPSVTSTRGQYAVNRRCTFRTGALTGERQTVSTWNGSVLGTPAFSQAPAPGDTFYLQRGVNDDRQSSNHAMPWVGPGGAQPHTTPILGDATTVFANTYAEYRYSQLNLTSAYRKASSGNGGKVDRDNPYVQSLYQDEILIRDLECLIVLHRVGTQTVSGNTAWPAFTGAKVPSGCWWFSPAAWTTAANSAVSTNGDQSTKAHVLLPTSPTIDTVKMNDHTGTLHTDVQYQYRLEIGDYTEPGTTRYTLMVYHFRDSDAADVTCDIVDNGATWTVTIAGAGGTATVTINKGLTGAEGAVVMS